MRVIRLIELLSLENYTVFIYGQEEYFFETQKEDKINICSNMQECISKSDIIISGIPLTKDNITIYSPYSKSILRLDVLQKEIGNKLLIAGGIPKWICERNENIKVLDLLELEELTVLNAIPTVEGTIKIAIEETEYTIHESNILILGYGRIGKILCKKFKMLGANIFCASRRASDLAWIREERCIPVKFEEIKDYCKNINIIINTVPDIVIKDEILKKISKETLIIDIASKPGGVDKTKAELYNIRVITALGIPGKIAPKTAAKYIKDVIKREI